MLSDEASLEVDVLDIFCLDVEGVLREEGLEVRVVEGIGGGVVEVALVGEVLSSFAASSACSRAILSASDS